VRIPFLETFDLPPNSVSCARRIQSTVAPQALTLLNGLLTTHAAEALASTTDRCKTPAEKTQFLFQTALQRLPRPEETIACEKFLQHHTPAELARAILNLNEFIYVD
jgi:hypothetical protein